MVKEAASAGDSTDTGLAGTLSGIICRVLLPGLSVLVKHLHPIETVEDQTQGSAQVQRNNK